MTTFRIIYHHHELKLILMALKIDQIDYIILNIKDIFLILNF